MALISSGTHIDDRRPPFPVPGTSGTSYSRRKHGHGHRHHPARPSLITTDSTHSKQHKPPDGTPMKSLATQLSTRRRPGLEAVALFKIQPVVGWVGVAPFGPSRSNPSGVFNIPGAVPAAPVMPYCQTRAPVVGSIATIRLE